MARVVALIPDLLFGSQVQGQLVTAGHDVELVGNAKRVRERLAGDAERAREWLAGDAERVKERPVRGAERAKEQPAGTAVLVVDLTNADLDGTALVRELIDEGALRQISTLGFYAHVDPGVRIGALQAGFDLVVPRSRMAREGAELVARLAGGERL